MADLEPLAPEYRYFTADLLTNETLEEIPFRGVGYGRAVKGAGVFQGKIPVIPQTENLNLYETTIPGKTALYVVRNNKCVWGGIIWSRQYDVNSRDLSISASEFTSYLYRRMIWKTWNHEYGATLVISGGIGTVVFDYGSNVAVATGSSVHIDFYEPSDFRYNGYYRVATAPAPTLSGFSVVGGRAVADVSSVEVRAGIAYITTESSHGFSSGDLITLATSYGSPFNGTFEIVAPQGSLDNKFSFTVTSGDIPRTQDYGTAVRPVADGTYTNVTVAVRSDTWDYVRTLIDSTFNDFVGTEFPNVYLEPGLSFGFDVVSKQLEGGLATITTAAPHNLAVGQAVQIQDVGAAFDGEFEVVATPSGTSFRYAAGGALSSRPVAPLEAVITGISLFDGTASITTQEPHNYAVGNTVSIFVGYIYNELNGDQVITSIVSPTSFCFSVSSPNTINYRALPSARAGVFISGSYKTTPIVAAQVLNDVATFTVDGPPLVTPGATVYILDTNRTVGITRKSLDAPNSQATITTNPPHGFVSGATGVVIDGLRDTSSVVKKSNTSSRVTMLTKPAHNFKVGDSVEISNMLDVYPIINRSLTSLTATINFGYVHNLPVSSKITVESLIDNFSLSSRSLVDNVASVTTTISHNLVPNDEITITGIKDSATVVSKAAEDGIAVLTLSAPHNFLEAEEVTISGIGGAPFEGTFTLLAVTSTRIFYEIENEKKLILPVRSGGLVAGTDSIFNGTFTVSSVTQNTVQFHQVGENMPAQPPTSGANLATLSALNGVHTVSGGTATSVQFTFFGHDIPSAPVPQQNDDDDDDTPQAQVSAISVHSGTKIISAITRDTFSFEQNLQSDPVLRSVSGQATVASIFNGVKTLTSTTKDTFKYGLSAISNVIEDDLTYIATASHGFLNGQYTVLGVDMITRTFTVAKSYQDVPNFPVQSQGTAVVKPTAIVSSFGPYPGNADIGLQYSTRRYSGKNVSPVAYRGFELTNVGEALDQYSDSVNGFEYRIDCAFDVATQQFTKTFVLVPIDFPNPPVAGAVSDISRFGADKLVFEYPGGSITNLSLLESADESSTRFFAVGESDLGPDVGPNISIAAATDLLSGLDGSRRWPLLDASEKVNGVDDKGELYAYAQRYLSETRPPDASFSVSVNGSIAPLAGTYNPGDWCSLIINDPFILMRLASELEPRDDVIVRKIESYNVTVPDGITFPEKVTLNLVAEWEVDKRG